MNYANRNLEEHSRPLFKKCAVPLCKNTIWNAPNKEFLLIPQDAMIRKKWCTAMKRKIIPKQTIAYCCEDHFNLEKDTGNYLQYIIMGTVGVKVELRLKKNVLPHLFHCQKSKPMLKTRNTLKRIMRTFIEKAQSESVQSPTQDPDLFQTVSDARGPLEKCSSCRNNIDGFLFACLECDYISCDSCDAANVHNGHYILRMPKDLTMDKMKSLLVKIQEARSFASETGNHPGDEPIAADLGDVNENLNNIEFIPVKTEADVMDASSERVLSQIKHEVLDEISSEELSSQSSVDSMIYTLPAPKVKRDEDVVLIQDVNDPLQMETDTT